MRITVEFDVMPDDLSEGQEMAVLEEFDRRISNEFPQNTYLEVGFSEPIMVIRQATRRAS